MADELTRYIGILKEKIGEDYELTLREPGAVFAYPFLSPGSSAYQDTLWDWDSWLSNVALRQTLLNLGSPERSERAIPHERGCILNFLSWTGMVGWMPIAVARNSDLEKIRPADIYRENMHKPVLAQHAAFLVRMDGGDAEWLREKFQYLQAFVNNYKNHHRHCCGLYYWQTDYAIGVDTDPCTFFRPPRSSGSIYLNSLMVKELEAIGYLCDCLSLGEIGEQYRQDAGELRQAIQRHCWDERDGSFYSVDLNLLPNEGVHDLHNGLPRDYDTLIQRIDVWSNFLPLWAGVATPEQAERMVAGHYRNPRTFHAPYGIRSLSKLEKMYNVRATNNPSSWNGPIWGIANYLTFRGLVRYGFTEDARDLTEKTIRLFGRDMERFGALHEYYAPESGEPILHRGFQNWNHLVLNMIAWREGAPVVSEF